MGLGILKRVLIAAAAVLSAIASQPAKAAVYDVTLGGTMNGVRFSSFGALPSVVGEYLNNGAVMNASFRIDVDDFTINSVTGTVDLDGLSGAITSLNSNSGGSGFRGFSVRFEDIGTGSAQVNDVRVDELAFRMTSSSGDTFDDNFEDALSNGSALFRAAITAAHRTSTSTTFFHRGFFDGDGALSIQSVSIAAVPVPAGLLLMLTGLAGLGFVARNRVPRA